jgi:hypothetical protein
MSTIKLRIIKIDGGLYENDHYELQRTSVTYGDRPCGGEILGDWKTLRSSEHYGEIAIAYNEELRVLAPHKFVEVIKEETIHI